jgi:hypothetical protein
MTIAGLVLSIISVLALVSAGIYICVWNQRKPQTYQSSGINDAARANIRN